MINHKRKYVPIAERVMKIITSKMDRDKKIEEIKKIYCPQANDPVNIKKDEENFKKFEEFFNEFTKNYVPSLVHGWTKEDNEDIMIFRFSYSKSKEEFQKFITHEFEFISPIKMFEVSSIISKFYKKYDFEEKENPMRM